MSHFSTFVPSLCTTQCRQECVLFQCYKAIKQSAVIPTLHGSDTTILQYSDSLYVRVDVCVCVCVCLFMCQLASYQASLGTSQYKARQVARLCIKYDHITYALCVHVACCLEVLLSILKGPEQKKGMNCIYNNSLC